jgi:3-deoxy-manno-octulosonate cytidylyltransferase (CMP-KDO synthetase)
VHPDSSPGLALDSDSGPVVAIIPARYQSSRLPGKALADIGGRPMIEHVYRRAAAATSVSSVLVATDDERILEAVRAFGGVACLTSPDHQSGTDRLAEVAAELGSEIVVNVQGDEPLIEPATIEAALAPLLADGAIVMGTTCEPIESVEDALNPNVVKVVVDRAGFALYFSRQPVPLPRAETLGRGSVEAALRADPGLLRLFAKHTGLYAYRRDFLLAFAALEPTPLERAELLEQLRALEHGYRIRVVPVSDRSIGVDTPADLERVRELMDRRGHLCFNGGRPADDADEADQD